MKTSSKIYSLSGSIHPKMYPLTIFGFLGAAVLSLIYAYILVYAPIAGYVSLLFLAGFAFGLGYMVSKLGFYGKCRNKIYMYIFGFIIGCVGIYLSWAFFIYALSNKEIAADIDLLKLIMMPEVVWEVIKELNKTGWYTVKSWTPTGMALWAFWGIEFAVILTIPVFLSVGTIESNMFCEDCKDWCKLAKRVYLGYPENNEILLKEISEISIQAVSKLETVSFNYYPRIEVVIYKCKTCVNSSGYKLELKTEEINKNGQPEEKSTDLTSINKLNQDELILLESLAERPVKEKKQAADDK